MATEEVPRPRRRRGVAFFEPIADESDASSSSSESKPNVVEPASTTNNSTKALLFAALPILLLVVYLLIPAHSTQAPVTASHLRDTTPLTPFLTSLTSLTALSPAPPFTGLATHMLVRDLNSTSDRSADLMTLAQRAQELVEEFSGEEDAFRSGVLDTLQGFLSVENFTEAGMKEGYASFLEGQEMELEALVKRTGEMGLVLGRLRGDLGAFEREGEKVREGVDRLGKIVEWVGLVVGKADVGYKDLLLEASKGRKAVNGLPKGWMEDGILEREKEEIKKYMEVERKALAVVFLISQEYMEGKVEGGVEAKLEAAMAKGEVNWW